MAWDRNWEKKWLTPAHGIVIDKKFINKCALVIRDANLRLVGFTVFSASDLVKSFVERIKIRKQQTLGSSVTLYASQHAIDSLGQMEDEFVKNISLVTSPFFHLKVSGFQLEIRSRAKVVNVDDSQVILKYLKRAFEDMGWIEVISQVADPRQAVACIQDCHPDVVTMDIQMPHLNGVELLANLLAVESLPVIMVSSLNQEEGTLVFRALQAGAFDYIQKPAFSERSDFSQKIEEKILEAIGGQSAQVAVSKQQYIPATPTTRRTTWPEDILWTIGASTGGPQALTAVLRAMPKNIPPLLIVQHIPAVFSKSFAESLNDLCPFAVKEAVHGDIVEANQVYVAPGGYQMSVIKSGGRLRIVISDDDPVNRFKPSVDFLFTSIAKLPNIRVVAAVLTGMGKDGAQGLLKLRQSGAFTMAQDEASSVVYGMPRAAHECGGASTLVSLERVADQFMQFSEKIVRKSA